MRTYAEARSAWLGDKSHLASLGAIFPMAQAYATPGIKANYQIAMDSVPSLTTTDPNSAIPAMLTTFIDPDVVNVLFAPNAAADIFGEVKKGDWLMSTALFPVVEGTGEVSSYGDYNENGRVGINTNWVNRQNYLFQTMTEYGEREMELAGLGRINWVAGLDKQSVVILNKFANLNYFYGLNGLMNYGLINDPALPAALTPATKANGGVTWFTAGGAPNATANEVYDDILSIVTQVVIQGGGTIQDDAQMTLALSPKSSMALKFTNSFGINVAELLKENFPNMTVKKAVQYGAKTSTNTQGNAGGEFVQLIVKSVEGQDTGYCAFSEKMRAHKVIPAASSWKQKKTGGVWGAIIRQPFAIASMLGV